MDVNHAPVAVLAALPGFTPEMAERVAEARVEHHGFDFVEELEAYADLPQGLADELAERFVFLRIASDPPRPAPSRSGRSFRRR
ncbi:ComEA family DNA-binding protein [Streptomyces sp. ISL-96]|uniref:ComEA family DNA-binding protein n=1 Tax=Streptomyces sp. ISL-96 TaxID=2819191 RepID=UPI0035ABF7E7